MNLPIAFEAAVQTFHVERPPGGGSRSPATSASLPLGGTVMGLL